MATPPRSPPPPDSPSAISKRKTPQTTRLRRLTSRSLDEPQPTVNVNPITGRGFGPNKEKFHSYLGVVAWEKIHIVHSTWKVVPETLKNLIWDDILDSNHNVRKPVGRLHESNAGVAKDPLGELMKILFMDECGRSRGDGSIYGFLEPQSIHNAKDRREECQHYIQTWVKESQRHLYLGAYLHDAMKTITTSFKGMFDQPAPRWVEPKSHVQTRGYECGYYVMHWMWCIVTGSLKDEWNKVYSMLHI
ncbi:hypothetical protein JHK82_052834 [Glycine max]|nr:hypothetical protein JHK86_052689 [Glycine max]KAG4927056.1 hypothetical protein JHK85_053542 [Glycine max]KAG5082680.1 hypothetical protein JHK84_052718 [Glycine max]KAG5085437.1 hypothetical protein JHK82_052834 [Glycine max]